MDVVIVVVQDGQVLFDAQEGQLIVVGELSFPIVSIISTRIEVLLAISEAYIIFVNSLRIVTSEGLNGSALGLWAVVNTSGCRGLMKHHRQWTYGADVTQ